MNLVWQPWPPVVTATNTASKTDWQYTVVPSFIEIPDGKIDLLVVKVANH